MNVEAVIFDLDGTLVDTIVDIVDSANRMLEDHGYPVYEVSDYLDWIGNGAIKLIERALPGDRAGKEHLGPGAGAGEISPAQALESRPGQAR